MSELSIYNLVFPDNVHTLDIAGYQFMRASNYAQAFAGLQHTIDVMGGEFPVVPTNGSHQKTATLSLPVHEEPPLLPWINNSNCTRLQDVLLFLSLFTGRNVFALKPEHEGFPIRRDLREHFWGGQFRLSARINEKYRRHADGQLYSPEEVNGKSIDDYDHLNLGLPDTVNEVLQTISDETWRRDYDTGYFIFTFRQALGQSDIEPAFLLCWTIWEHLFTLHTKAWQDIRSIEQTSGDKKIAYIMNRYLLLQIDDAARKQVRRLTGARNRLIHFGAIPTDVDINEMKMFIRTTEQIMAIILRLTPSNAFNTIERLQSFLRGEVGGFAL